MQESAPKVGSELEALTVELGAPSRVRIIEDAVPPRTRDDKKRLMILGTDHYSARSSEASSESLFSNCKARRSIPLDEVPCRPGAPGGWHLTARAAPQRLVAEESHAVRTVKKDHYASTSCWNQSTPPGSCCFIPPAPGCTGW